MNVRNLILWAGAAVLASQAASAQGFFLPADDTRIRDDLSLLVDEGVINLPVNEWPLPRVDVAEAIGKINEEELQDGALRAALRRLRLRTAAPENAADWALREVRVTAGEPGLLRHEGTLGRENGELRSMGGAFTDRWSINLAATGVIDPQDGQKLRADGSEITARWGNWLFSVNQVERWWGPGHDGSLILSTNARPMPGVSLDRLRSTPIDFPILRWLGPWRFTGFLSVMENNRADVDHPVFMGMRLSFKPAPIFEFGLSRTAQFCGKGRPCNVGTLGRVLIGQDNVGRRGLNNPEDEPGNQMAGMDLRIVSPFHALPLALYASLIGEDNSNSGIPERYLGLFGAETWWMLDSGSVLRTRVEYANTKCKWYDGVEFFDCAYRQGIFFAGYRYHSRNVGHTTDADAESTGVTVSLTRPDGSRWGARWRHANLDRAIIVDPYNPLTQGRSAYNSGELTWDGVALKQNLSLQLGYEKRSPKAGATQSGAYGFIQWRIPL